MTYPKIEDENHHFNKYPDHPWLKSKSLIKEWLNKYDKNRNENKYIIHEDFTVTVQNKIDKKINIFQYDGGFKKLKHIPIQFRVCENFECKDQMIENLIGTPYECLNLDLDRNKIESFLGLSCQMTIGRINIMDNNLKNFKGMLYCPLLKRITMFGNESMESWDGLSCEGVSIGWWNRELKSNSLQLMLNAPKNVIGINCVESFKSIVLSNNFSSNGFYPNSIDMAWIRDEQRKNNNIVKVNSKINEIMEKDKDKVNERKRKL